MTIETTSLFLSRLILNPRSRQVMSEMAQPYEMHRTLMRAFPKATDEAKAKARDEFGVLFRADAEERRKVVKVYVQSYVGPDWSFLDDLYDYLGTDPEMPAHEYKHIMPKCRQIENGQVLSFRLRANPSKRIAKSDDGMKGKRVGLTREHEQIDWLIRKGKVGNNVPGGFRLLMKGIRDANGEEQPIPCVRILPEGKQTGRKKDAARRHATTHLAVLFEGLLQVTDSPAFLETLAKGIGPAKAFGFGLLSVAPA